MQIALLLLAALSAEELLTRAIAYHDPQGVFASGAFELELGESRPDGTERTTSILLDNGAGRFAMTRETAEGRRLEIEIEGERVVATKLDGDSSPSAAEREQHRLGEEQVLRTRNYYAYLYGLPMKLRDAGTRLDPEARPARFQGKPVQELRVTYDASVGSDTWYFYLDPETSALVGYRFYHDEAANDGEYIVLSSEAEGGGLRLPRVRSWYRNADDGFLGTDRIQTLRRR